MKVETECPVGLTAEVDLNDYLIVPREVKTSSGIQLTHWLQIPNEKAELHEITPTETIKTVTPLKVRLGSLMTVGVARLIVASPLLALLGYFVVPPLVDRFTPVDTLTERIYNREIYNFSGAKCNDGWTSHSQGSGTCSYHDGVDYYFSKGDHKKSVEECRAEAIEISWIE